MTQEPKKCKPCEGISSPLAETEAQTKLAELNGWVLSSDGLSIQKTVQFKNFFRTMSFVNMVAYVANEQNHHPDLSVSYGRCVVTFTTHAIGGLSENDFVCAGLIEQIIGNN